MKLIGILLIIAGALMIFYRTITYTRHEKVADLGPLEVNKEERQTVPLSPIVGGLALVGGVVVLVASNRRRMA